MTAADIEKAINSELGLEGILKVEYSEIPKNLEVSILINFKEEFFDYPNQLLFEKIYKFCCHRKEDIIEFVKPDDAGEIIINYTNGKIDVEGSAKNDQTNQYFVYYIKPTIKRFLDKFYY